MGLFFDAQLSELGLLEFRDDKIPYDRRLSFNPKNPNSDNGGQTAIPNFELTKFGINNLF